VVPQLESGKAVRRAYLGIESSADPVSPNGAQIQTIVPGGPAEKAGLRKGDVVKAIDGAAVKDSTDVSSAVATKKPGDKITIQIERNGLTQEIEATLGVRPKQTP
jgi:S1-C subfamily serine protease